MTVRIIFLIVYFEKFRKLVLLTIIALYTHMKYMYNLKELISPKFSPKRQPTMIPIYMMMLQTTQEYSTTTTTTPPTTTALARCDVTEGFYCDDEVIATIEHIPSRSDCQAICQNHPECNWWSFWAEGGGEHWWVTTVFLSTRNHNSRKDFPFLF